MLLALISNDVCSATAHAGRHGREGQTQPISSRSDLEAPRTVAFQRVHIQSAISLTLNALLALRHSLSFCAPLDKADAEHQLSGAGRKSNRRSSIYVLFDGKYLLGIIPVVQQVGSRLRPLASQNNVWNLWQLTINVPTPLPLTAP